MKYAVAKNPHGGIDAVEMNAYVENVIVGEFDEAGRQNFEVALRAMLLDVLPLGLCIGDLFNGVNWTRNVDGEQVVLPILAESREANEVLGLLTGVAVQTTLPVAQVERTEALRGQMLMAGAVVAKATEDPETLLACEAVFDWWTAGHAYAEGDVVRHGVGLYRVRQAVTSLEHQPPASEGMLAVYTPVQMPDEGGEVLPWVSGEIVRFGEKRLYSGVVYECILPGGAGANVWTPDTAPAVWRAVAE